MAEKTRKSQIGIEYLLIVGLVVFFLISIMLIAFFYSNASRDTLRMNQVEGFAMKVISSSESVFYAGAPSKATISTYLPEGVVDIEIIENSIVISMQTNSGISKTSFSSKVPIEGSISTASGIKKIKIEAIQDKVLIGNA